VRHHFVFPSSSLVIYIDQEKALAAMEGTKLTYSIWYELYITLLQLCGAGDHIVSIRTIYGGTYAFLKNFAPRLGVQNDFVDILQNLGSMMEAAITPDF
jgi:methionine-gamma-lyase